MRRAALLAVLLAAACSDPPVDPLLPDAGLPDGADAGEPDSGCVTATCAERGAECGEVDDGCGATLPCGECTAPAVCAGAGQANRCGIPGCTAETDEELCRQLGADCDAVDAIDRCGRLRTVECGACQAPLLCGGGGTDNVCGCEDATSPAAFCQRLGTDCGSVQGEDLCGRPRTEDCGACTLPDTCGGGGTAHVCADPTCSESDAEFCARLGKNCEEVSGTDVCGAPRTADCGTCAEGTVCGASGTANVCAACLRLMAANISSGNYQSYDPGHGMRIMTGLDPDVVMIQEFNYGSDSASDIREMVDKTFGADPAFSYYREGGASIPNGVISRYPILASGEWRDSEVNNRDFAWARIDVPGPRDLWAVSVHLLTSSSGDRNREATQLKGYIQANVPAGDYLAIGGDFNTDSRSEACFSTLSAVVSTAGPHPVDNDGTSGTNASRSKPYDAVLASPNLRAYEKPVQLGNQRFMAGIVFDSRVYTPLSDVYPVQSGDSGATNMQHMAVMREYCVPTL